MAAEPHLSGQALPPGPSIFLYPAAPEQLAPDGLNQAYTVALAAGPVRRVVYRSVVAGSVTCMVDGADVLGSAGVPLRVDAVATAPTADQARQQALSLGLARHAAGLWDADALSKHPPQPPHGTGPGPWVRMWVGDGQREVWMPAARVFSPFRLANGRLVGDHEGLACAGSLEAARAGAQMHQVKQRALLPLWQALERQKRTDGAALALADGVRDLVVGHAHGLSLAVSFQWAAAGPFYGVAGLGCAVDDASALALASSDRVHTEAQLRLQQAGVWGEQAQSRPPDMDHHVHRLAWNADEAMAMAALVSRWRARARPTASTAQRSALAWADLTPPALREMGLCVVRSLWLDGEGGWLSRPTQLSPPY